MRKATALDVDQRFEMIEPAIDCSLLDHRRPAPRTRTAKIVSRVGDVAAKDTLEPITLGPVVRADRLKRRVSCLERLRAGRDQPRRDTFGLSLQQEALELHSRPGELLRPK
jgi:hypothetical protein